MRTCAQAEDALVSAESGQRGNHTRADAVSSLAEARIQIERAARSAPWRSGEIGEARTKLDDADAQIQNGNFSAAIFFVYSAKRIAAELEREADLFDGAENARFVRGQRVNLRSGPSTDERVVQVLAQGTPVYAEGDGESWSPRPAPSAGTSGWIHGSLLERR